MKNFSKKPEHRFLVESTKIENASFQYKTTISEANVKGALSSLRQFSGTESPLKMMKNAFYFTLTFLS